MSPQKGQDLFLTAGVLAGVPESAVEPGVAAEGPDMMREYLVEEEGRSNGSHEVRTDIRWA